MNILTKNKEERLSLFRSLYEQAKQNFEEQLSLFDVYMEQYRGSDRIDGSAERAATVRNITYELVESQVSSDIPAPKVDPVCHTEARMKNAKAVERLLSTVRDRLSYEEMNDLDERFTYVYGGSVWFAEWDSGETAGGEAGGVKISCLSPKCFIPQPGIVRVDDMDYCFLRFPTTRADLHRTYGIAEEDLPLSAVETDTEASVDDSEIATVIVCFYRDDDGKIGKFVFSGDLTLSDLPDCYSRKVRRCHVCGASENACRCGKKAKFVLENQPYEILRRETVRADGKGAVRFLPDDGAEEGGETVCVPYYTPKYFPVVIRKNTSLESLLFGQSDCAFIRHEQQAINKIESRILQKLLRAGITPVVPEDATVALNNAVFGQVIKMKPGETPSQYGTVDTTPDISQDVAEAERLYLHAKRILGITDAYQGISASNTESGYAKQLQISQSSGRLESKRKMKHTAYADLDRLIFEYYLAYADEPRRLSYRDAYGNVQDTTFSRYDFLVYDEAGDTYRYDDGYLFSVDMNGGAEGQREELWARNLENLTAGALGDPTQPSTLLRYWQCQERAHYPFARENVEYFRDATERRSDDPETQTPTKKAHERNPK